MASEREERYSKLTLDGLADALAGPDPGSPRHGIVMAEVIRRQTLAQQEATEAQQTAADAQVEAAAAAKTAAEDATKAAQAAVETALFTRRNARYLLLSVIVLAISSALSLWIQYSALPKSAG